MTVFQDRRHPSLLPSENFLPADVGCCFNIEKEKKSSSSDASSDEEFERVFWKENWLYNGLFDDKGKNVPKEGLEPSHGVKPYWILSPARLPIPPLRQHLISEEWNAIPLFLFQI